MGLFSCFGLRTKSYNAKKYELRDERDKKKKRVSTDSIGVADTNVYPQLIEETGGGIHPIHSNHDLEATKDANENICQLTDDQKNDINRNDSIEDNKQNQINSEDKADDKCEQFIENELTKESGHQNQCTPVHQTNDDSAHHNHSVSEHNTFGCDTIDQSHGTDHNTSTMDTTTDFSGGADTGCGDTSGGGGGDSSACD